MRSARLKLELTRCSTGDYFLRSEVTHPIVTRFGADRAYSTGDKDELLNTIADEVSEFIQNEEQDGKD